MNFREALQQLMERYYQITAEYRISTVDAMKDARKPGLFKKRDYSGHIKRFQRHIMETENLDKDKLMELAESEEEKELAELFRRGVIAFIMLCEENIRFYDITERKQYRNSGVTVQEYADRANMLQGVLEGAVKETEKLEQAYRKYCTGNLANE